MVTPALDHDIRRILEGQVRLKQALINAVRRYMIPGHLPYAFGNFLPAALAHCHHHIHALAGYLLAIPYMEDQAGDSPDLPDLGRLCSR